MPATAPESLIYRDLFGTAAMRAVWDDAALARQWATAEAALAQAQAALGMIPEAAAAAIAEAASGFAPDLAAIGRKTELVGYPIVELVHQLADACPEHARGYVHWGATTQDIMDTGTVLCLRDALALVEADCTATRELLAGLAHAHRDTPMAGRTHLQHALPVTFGQKVAVWLDAMDRHAERLEQLRPRLLRASLGGAAGTLASMGEHGLAVRAGFAAALGLADAPITWHAARDAFAEAAWLLAAIGGTMAKAATDIMLMCMDELGEAREPFLPGRGSSSTMPQKANPIACEIIVASARRLRADASQMLDAMPADFERATGPWHLEWLALPEAFVVASGMLAQAKFLFGGLVVYPDRMARNLGLTRGLILAEAVMMRLAPLVGRGVAHDLVYACCRQARDRQQTLAEALLAEPRVTRHLDAAGIAVALDPANYLGSAGAMVDRVLAGRGRVGPG
jgi:3-carboxy-cis,cis-muconate cycloisomerase